MAENFDLIFGQNASQQYAWSDSDYQDGWETVGNIPPTKEQFDALQRRNDMKSQELNNRLTPIETKSGSNTRQPSTAYSAGDMQTAVGLKYGWYLECTVGGTTSASALEIPSPLNVGDTVTDGTVVWTIEMVGRSPNALTREITPAFNTRDVITTSGTYTAPVTGWYKVTCIGGGGAGGNGGKTTNGGLSGTQGGTTTFGTYCTADGGHSGGGGGALGAGGGGAAGEVATAYIQLDANDTVACTIGAGGVAPSSGFSSTKTGVAGSGGATGGSVTGGGQGAISVYGSGNNGSPYNLGESSTHYNNAPTGFGGSNGTCYGGGGGGGVTHHQDPTPAYSAVGGANGKAGTTITVRDSTYPKGGDGGNGAIIVEYFATI